MVEVKFQIPGEPMGKQRPKFGNGFTYTPTKTVNYEMLVKQIYATEKLPKLTGELSVKIMAFYSIPKSTSGKKSQLMKDGVIRPTKKPDWDNVGKIICDSLNKIAYDDDAQITTALVVKYFSDTPRVEVELKEVQGF